MWSLGDEVYDTYDAVKHGTHEMYSRRMCDNGGKEEFQKEEEDIFI